MGNCRGSSWEAGLSWLAEAQLLLILAYVLPKTVSLFAKCSWRLPAATTAAPQPSAPENIQIRFLLVLAHVFALFLLEAFQA